MNKHDLDTPALLLDVDALDRNIRTMQDWVTRWNCALRPHFKSFRMPAICKRQRDAGAIGFTCAKLAEAELLADLGFDHLLIANEVIGDAKWRRLAELAKRVEVIVAVDSVEGIAGTARAAREAGSEVGVVVEMNIGLNRCGVAPGEPALQLAQVVADTPGVRLRGVMGYEGHLVDVTPLAEKEKQVRAAIRLLTDTADLMRAHGLPVEIITAGGTGTAEFTPRCGTTEIQAGTYCVMDLLFKNRTMAAFEHAITVLATVISRPTKDRAITDAGRKALHPLGGMGQPKGIEGATLETIHSEHGLMKLTDPCDLRIGTKIEFIPSYAEGTINLYDHVYVLQSDRVVDVWQVSGRGKSQ
ncbi:MAG: DSD1 family PLP-dependent enzyme [Abditibacteriales bacterium]|nr:DSD1 family PLP-dependent enzyme [Abditibacteriales bacterium]MDW8367007.1 DSD1 family PLP-dependent enzyme [Abditibacteriales bacterium]